MLVVSTKQLHVLVNDMKEYLLGLVRGQLTVNNQY